MLYNKLEIHQHHQDDELDNGDIESGSAGKSRRIVSTHYYYKSKQTQQKQHPQPGSEEIRLNENEDDDEEEHYIVKGIRPSRQKSSGDHSIRNHTESRMTTNISEQFTEDSHEECNLIFLKWGSVYTGFIYWVKA